MKKIIFFCTLFICQFLQSCITPTLAGNINVGKKLINPVVVDFVFVFEQKVLDEVQKIPSSQWFAKRTQYINDWEASDQIQIMTYELAPGQQATFSGIAPKNKPLSLVIYVYNDSNQDNRIILKNFSKVKLEVDKEEVKASILN